MINYIVPEEKLAPVLLKEQLAVYSDFSAGGIRGVNADTEMNSCRTWQKLEGHLESLLAAICWREA